MRASYNEDTLNIIVEDYEKVFDYPYDDWITVSYDKRTGNLAEIKVEGMSRIQDKGYPSYDVDTDTIDIRLSDKEVIGCDFFWSNPEHHIMFSIDRDHNGNLLGIELINIGKFMELLLTNDIE
jgi:hypothetical protein